MRGPRNTRLVVGRTIAKELADLHAFAWQIAGIGALVLYLLARAGMLLRRR